MAAGNNTTVADSDGDVFSSNGFNATVTLYGSHFHKVVPVATLALSLLWFSAFVGFLIAMIVIRSRAQEQDRAMKYLRWPVFGLSLICTISYWATESGNRIVHEMELTISRWFLVITVPMEIMCATARTLLMAFLLWQLTPDLLDYGSFSEPGKKAVLCCFRATVVFIAIFDTADTILSAVVYIIKTLTPFVQSLSKRDASTGCVNSISSIQRCYSGLDAIVNAIFNCTYLACALAFAVLVILALRTPHRANNFDGTLKIYLSLLAAAIFLRSLLDTIWSVVFKLAATFKSIDETLNMQLIQSALYGFLSVVAYVSILRLAVLPNTGDVKVCYEIVDGARKWKPSPDLKRSIYDYTIDTSIAAEDAIDRHRRYPADFDELNHSPVQTPRSNTRYRSSMPGEKHDYNQPCQGPGRLRKPEWFIHHPVEYEKGHPDFLCKTCRHIDLEYLFYKSKPGRTADPDEYIRLGSFSKIASETGCALCRIVMATIGIKIKLGQDAAVSGLEAERLLTANWYLSPFVYSHEQYSRGYQLYLRPNVSDADQRADTTHLSPSYPFGLRLVTNKARGGRRIPADHLDFGWIKTTVELCERSTEMPARNFDRQVRVIDTVDMCIVNLTSEDRYVALSYPWGSVKRLMLVQENQSFLRRAGGLFQVFGQLPRTIQDAIILVSKVGERYLWLDSLCIVQDDKIDVRQQMEQMGEIYRHSYFTIFAISGQDANYGLPGVRPGTRKLKQIFQKVGNLTIANTLPWMEEEDLLRAGAWGSRGWTLQERFRAQRGLFIGDDGMIINCTHVYSPEDEHCWHTLTKNMIARGSLYFYSGQDKRCEPYLMHTTGFDTFAQMVSEYTQRSLTYQSDALRAFFGVLSTLESNLDSKFIHGLPEAEFDASLLWSPVGSSIRRCDPHTMKPLFPSWSWLGWIGHAAYPWTLERDSFVSTATSPLTWQHAATVTNARRPWYTSDDGLARLSDVRDGLNSTTDSTLISQNATYPKADASWFTSDDLCLPPSPYRERLLLSWRRGTADHLGVRKICRAARRRPDSSKFQIQWPNGCAPDWQYVLPGSHRLSFRTLSAMFYVVGRPFRRRRLYNMQHSVFRLAVCDEDGHLAGYIDVPGPNTGRQISLGEREFVVLSRSTINGTVEPEPDRLENRRRKRFFCNTPLGYRCLKTAAERENFQPFAEAINEKGHFDTFMYDEHRPWCMFNVMMISRINEVAYRDAIGRIHVDAFLAHHPRERIIDLE